MNLSLTPNKHLFLMFLLINEAGYCYENNSKGEHETRKKFRKKTKESINKYPEIMKFVKIIKKTKMPTNEYVRLVNLVIPLKNKIDLSKFCEDKNISKKIKNQFNKISKIKKIDDLFNEYKKDLKDIQNYKVDNFNKELNKVLNFFHLDKNIKLDINIHLNLLESYYRGTNYSTNSNQIISTSLDFDNKINWQTVRHEFMHLLLKKIFKNDLENKKIIISVNKNYSRDNLRVKFEENFILAANLFFLDEQKKRDCNLKYFYNCGYKKIYIFYSLIEDYFIKSKQKLSNKLLDEFLMQI